MLLLLLKAASRSNTAYVSMLTKKSAICITVQSGYQKIETTESNFFFRELDRGECTKLDRGEYTKTK